MLDLPVMERPIGLRRSAGMQRRRRPPHIWFECDAEEILVLSLSCAERKDARSAQT
jgi:hypothetical protein